MSGLQMLLLENGLVTAKETETGRAESKASGTTFLCFFFQAEDGIRDYKVTGVQTCALPICFQSRARPAPTLSGVASLLGREHRAPFSESRLLLAHQDRWSQGRTHQVFLAATEIGRASCRERV